MTKSVQKPLVDAAFGRKPHRQPVWFLRQAGRYLPEYRKVRSEVSFLDLCKNPKLAAEVTLQPLRRFDLDAAIIFSDILIPPTAMGQNLTFAKDHGPLLNEPVRSGAQVKALQRPNSERELGFVGEAIALTKSGLRPDQTMIGFCGAPFTVASYMIEGQGSKTFTETKKFIYGDTAGFSELIELLVDVSIDYLGMQVKAGADALMLFDTWVGNLMPKTFRMLLAPAMIRLIGEIKRRYPEVPVIYYPGQGSELYEELHSIPMDVVAVDWRVPLERAIKRFGDLGLQVSVQGNLDPQVLLAEDPAIENEVQLILAEGRKARGHIFNVGHGLLPHLEPHKLNVAIDAIRKHS